MRDPRCDCVSHFFPHWGCPVHGRRHEMAPQPVRDRARAPIYVASRASLEDRPAMWRRLRAEGWPINSTWVDEAGPEETKSFPELWQRIEHEVTEACGVILFAMADDFPLKGALIEVGMALGQGKRIGVVLPDVTIELPHVRPVGSWVRHPRVKLCSGVMEAREWVQGTAGVGGNDGS